MKNERKIQAVVKKMSLAEAEKADDEYWSQTDEAYRLNTLYELRRMVYGDKLDEPIARVVFKRSIHEPEKDCRLQDIADGYKLELRKKNKKHE